MKFIILIYKDIWILIFRSVTQNISKRGWRIWELHHTHDLQRIKLRPFQLQHKFYSGEEQEGYMSC